MYIHPTMISYIFPVAKIKYLQCDLQLLPYGTLLEQAYTIYSRRILLHMYVASGNFIVISKIRWMPHILCLLYRSVYVVYSLTGVILIVISFLYVFLPLVLAYSVKLVIVCLIIASIIVLSIIDVIL